MEKTLFLPEGTTVTSFVMIGSPWGLLAVWVVILSIVTFCIFGLDKWKAKRKEKKESVRRVPEKTLFLLSILGGSPGALLGMRVFHHKTLHKRFRYGIPAILILQVLIPLGIWLWHILG